MQLESLVTRLSECIGPFGPAKSLQPIPVSVISDFEGRIAGIGDISLTSKALPGTEALHAKIEWIRKSAPMLALREAIGALATAFWASPCDEASMKLPAAPMASFNGKADLVFSPQQLQGPAHLVFLTVEDDGYVDFQTIDWKHIPSNVQETVQRWFFFFCFELSVFGYCVSIHRTFIDQSSRCLSIAGSRP